MEVLVHDSRGIILTLIPTRFMRLPQPGCTKPPNIQVCVHHSHGGWKSLKSLRKTRKNAVKPETINYPAEHLTRQSISPPWSALFQLLSTTISNDCDGPLDPPHISCLSQGMACIHFWLSLLLAHYQIKRLRLRQNELGLNSSSSSH